MWLVLGVSAIITSIMNIVWTLKHKDAKWFRFISMSLTALTLCAEYSLAAKWVSNEDWSALMDVAPAMSGMLWCLVLASIIINSISLFNKRI